MNKEKYVLYYKIKILVREINNKVLAVNQCEKKYKNIEKKICMKEIILKSLKPKSKVKYKNLRKARS